MENESDDWPDGIFFEMVSKGDNEFQKMAIVNNFYDCGLSFSLLKVC